MGSETLQPEDNSPRLIEVSKDETKMVIDPRLMGVSSIKNILLNQIYNQHGPVKITYELGDCVDEITSEQIKAARSIWPDHETNYFIKQKAVELSYADRIIIEHLLEEDTNNQT